MPSLSNLLVVGSPSLGGVSFHLYFCSFHLSVSEKAFSSSARDFMASMGLEVFDVTKASQVWRA
jgi:hypothetical protein